MSSQEMKPSPAKGNTSIFAVLRKTAEKIGILIENALDIESLNRKERAIKDKQWMMNDAALNRYHTKAADDDPVLVCVSLQESS